MPATRPIRASKWSEMGGFFPSMVKFGFGFFDPNRAETDRCSALIYRHILCLVWVEMLSFFPKLAGKKQQNAIFHITTQAEHVRLCMKGDRQGMEFSPYSLFHASRMHGLSLKCGFCLSFPLFSECSPTPTHSSDKIFQICNVFKV